MGAHACLYMHVAVCVCVRACVRAHARTCHSSCGTHGLCIVSCCNALQCHHDAMGHGGYLPHSVFACREKKPAMSKPRPATASRWAKGLSGHFFFVVLWGCFHWQRYPAGQVLVSKRLCALCCATLRCPFWMAWAGVRHGTLGRSRGHLPSPKGTASLSNSAADSPVACQEDVPPAGQLAWATSEGVNSEYRAGPVCVAVRSASLHDVMITAFFM